MSWSIVSTEEMASTATTPVFRHYQEAIGKDRIRLAAVKEGEPLDFTNISDVVLLRTASKSLIDEIRSRKLKSTAEEYALDELANDKCRMSGWSQANGIRVPRQHTIHDIPDSGKFFVKPRYGSDSSYISEKSICRSAGQAAERHMEVLKQTGSDAVIEDYIEGTDCTVAIWRSQSGIHTCAMSIDCPETQGIQTSQVKQDFSGFCTALYDKNLTAVAKDVFTKLGLKHHARMDFRIDSNGDYWLIDVNLIPGLSPIGLWAKCLLLSLNMSYKDAVNAAIWSSTRP